MKKFGAFLVVASSFIFAALWRKEVEINERLRTNITHKEFAHMDLRGDIINVLTESDPDAIKEELQDSLSRDISRFFENKHAGDRFQW